MKKKAISLALVAMLAISAVGCSSNNDEGKTTENNQKTAVENVDILPGKWSEDYTREEVKELIRDLQTSYQSEERGIRIDFLGDKLKLTTKMEHNSYYQ